MEREAKRSEYQLENWLAAKMLADEPKLSDLSLEDFGIAFRSHYERVKNIVANDREMEQSLRVEVKIPFDEVDRLVVNRLISIRNGSNDDDVTHIDETIKFFLTEDEFQKYVLDKQEISY